MGRRKIYSWIGAVVAFIIALIIIRMLSNSFILVFLACISCSASIGAFLPMKRMNMWTILFGGAAGITEASLFSTIYLSHLDLRGIIDIPDTYYVLFGILGILLGTLFYFAIDRAIDRGRYYLGVLILSSVCSLYIGYSVLNYSSPWIGPGGFSQELLIPESAFLPSKLGILIGFSCIGYKVLGTQVGEWWEERARYKREIRIKEYKTKLEQWERYGDREAKDLIKSVGSAIDKAKEFGCDLFEAEELIESAERAINIGNSEEAIKNAKEAKAVVKRIKGKAKPEIEVDLSKKDFRVGVWEKVLLKVLNRGNANARDTVIEFKRAEVEGLEIIKSLDVGEKRDLKLDFMPKDAGSVPLKIDIRFEDFDGKRYEETRTVHINVGEIKREERELIIERTIYDPAKGDFVISKPEPVSLPNVERWINEHDPFAYWFVLCPRNDSDVGIGKWGIEFELDPLLEIAEIHIEGYEGELPLGKSHDAKKGITKYSLSISEKLGLSIPRNGSKTHYIKLDSKVCNQEYEVRGRIMFDGKETEIGPKSFHLGCARGRSLKDAIKRQPDTAEKFGEARFGKIRLETMRSWIEVVKYFKSKTVEKTEFIGKMQVLERNMEKEGDYELKNEINEIWRRVVQYSNHYVPEKYLPEIENEMDKMLGGWCAKVY